MTEKTLHVGVLSEIPLAQSQASRRALAETLLIIGASLFVSLMAQLEIRTGWVPFTGQTFAVVLVGAVLGARRGALALGLYLLEGALGLPVFAGGHAGLPYAVGPTGGYLFGFIPAAAVVGYFAQKGWDRSVLRSVAMFVLGHGVIFLTGYLWLSQFLGFEKALYAGVVPFLPAMGVKVSLAATLLPSAGKVLQKLGWTHGLD